MLVVYYTGEISKLCNTVYIYRKETQDNYTLHVDQIYTASQLDYM